jgi:hypothetical protein
MADLIGGLGLPIGPTHEGIDVAAPEAANPVSAITTE